VYSFLYFNKEFDLIFSLSSGQIYCIDTEAENSGVPYADSFTVKTHICIYAETSASSRFLVRAEIVFRKELWGFLQEKIGKD
jgi:hypothetical protein